MNKLRRRAKKKIEREYFKFRRVTLRYATKSEIWNICHKVHFFCTVTEYFQLKPSIPKLYLELAVVDPALLQTMWDTYLKYEELQYETWADIEEILDKVVTYWKLNVA